MRQGCEDARPEHRYNWTSQPGTEIRRATFGLDGAREQLNQMIVLHSENIPLDRNCRNVSGCMQYSPNRWDLRVAAFDDILSLELGELSIGA